MSLAEDLKLMTTSNLEQISETIDELEKQIDKTNTLLTNMRPAEENIKVTTNFRVQNPRKLKYTFEPNRALFSKNFSSKRISSDFNQVRAKNRESFIEGLERSFLETSQDYQDQVLTEEQVEEDDDLDERVDQVSLLNKVINRQKKAYRAIEKKCEELEDRVKDTDKENTTLQNSLENAEKKLTMNTKHLELT